MSARRSAQLAAPHAIEQRLELVRELGDDGVAHRRAHSLDRVHGAEDRAHGASVAGRRVALELEQRVIDGRDVLAALGEKELGVLEIVHARNGRASGASARARAAPPRARGWLERLDHEVLRARLDRLDDQRLLPHRAAHQDSCASGSNLQISRTASMPPMSGITMSIVTRSGLELLVLLHRLHARLGFADDLESRLRAGCRRPSCA